MQSLKIDIIFPWEIGLILVFFSLIVILIGVIIYLFAFQRRITRYQY